MEGDHECKGPDGAEKSKRIAPIDEYDHDLGISITGGYVYHGKALPSLKGLYVYGDYNGKSWVLQKQGNRWERADLQLEGRPTEALQILSWGEDEAGEL